MWKVASALQGGQEERALLESGWEPFGVTTNPNGFTYTALRRRTLPATCSGCMHYQVSLCRRHIPFREASRLGCGDYE